MTAVVQCPKCGSSVSDSVAGGECVQCLMQLGIETSIAATTAHARGMVRAVEEIDALLPDFDVISLLGVGGMGGVYKAWQKHLERFVAIKVPPRSFIEDKQPLERFVRESKALAKLHHPNVVTIFDAGTTSKFPYLVMELVEGIDLGDFVRSAGPVDANTAVAWMIQVAEGLQFAHQKGIIHRDVKPNNLLLDDAGPVKILDLGLAKFDRDLYAEREAGALTDTGGLMGTVDFIAPELADGTRAADARTDIYALGCTLYYLLTGKILYARNTVVKTFLAHREQAIPSLREKQPGIPPELDAIFQQMVAKSPSDRPASMSEIASQLRAISSASDESATRVATLPAAEATAAEIAPTIDIKPQPAARTRAGLWLAGAVAAIAIGFVIYRVQTNRGTIIVKIDEQIEDQLAVTLDDGGIKLVNASDGETQTVAVGESTAVSAGDWQIVPIDGALLSARDRNGVEVNTERFTIRRDDLVLVEIALEKQEPNIESVRPRPEELRHHGFSPGALAVAPFDAANAKRYQQWWADDLGLPVERKVSLPGGETLTMVLIPPGEFMMGSTNEEQERFLALAREHSQSFLVARIPKEWPQHRVRITKPFFLGKYEVTQKQWESVMGSNPSQFTGRSNHPVERVSWLDVQEFLSKLNEDLDSDEVFALPTEAQWEYACRAGTTTPWCGGDSELKLRDYGWYRDNAGNQTHAVGTLKPNAFGLHDTHGNVWEWCVDWFEEDFYSRSPSEDPQCQAPTTQTRIRRGGSWGPDALSCRSAYRYNHTPDYSDPHIGFRLAFVLARQ